MPKIRHSFYDTWQSLRSASNRGWKPLSWLILKHSAKLIGLLLVTSLVFLTIFAAWVSRDLPDPNTLTVREIPQSTKIVDRTGTKVLYEIHGDERRTLVKINDIPIYVQHAAIAIEDRRFYEHRGIYWRGLLRAVLINPIKGQRIQGTSTLTQQFVKNAILDNQRSLLRKLKEFILALQIERLFSKDQILQMYLNEIPFGSNIYGIESAAQNYFGKSAKNLTLDECALLAAMIQRPDYYSPHGTGLSGDNRPRLINRQRYILGLMLEQGFINQAQHNTAKQTDTLKKLLPRRIGNISAPHFVMYVRSLLIDKYGQKPVEQGGLTVVTTLDASMQTMAEDETKKWVDVKGKIYGFHNAAAVSLDPKTGQILTMVGSHDFFDKEHDGEVNVTLSPRQPGSSFKPIVYAAAFIKGFRPETMLWDVLTSFKTDIGNYEPNNYNLKEYGPVTMRRALQGSLNIPAVKTLYLVGIGRALDFAETLGYTTLKQRNRFGLSLVLGGAEVTPLEHAAAYGVFATEGLKYPISAILKVTKPDGTVLEEWQPSAGERVMEPQIARLISNVLSDNDARSFIFGTNNALTLPGRPVAAKTGTTSAYHDAWTVGYTPSLVTAVWIGNNDNQAMRKGADSSAVAAPLWQSIMRKATRGLPLESFITPEPAITNKSAIVGRSYEIRLRIDTISGKRATELTPPELVEERSFYDPHTILQYIDKDDPLGDPPTNPTRDPQYIGWEAAIQTWVQKNQWNTTSTQPTQYDDLHTAGQRPTIIIEQPAPDTLWSTRSPTIITSPNASRPIARIEARLENILIGSSISAPWNINVHIPNSIEAGTHQLIVSAVDDIGNRGSTTIPIRLNAPLDAIEPITIRAPSPGQTWNKTAFPQQVVLSVPEATRFRRLDIQFVGTDGTQRLGASELLPTASDLIISIPLGPPPGEYQLRIVGQPQDETSPVSLSSIPITIAP